MYKKEIKLDSFAKMDQAVEQQDRKEETKRIPFSQGIHCHAKRVKEYSIQGHVYVMRE